MALTVRNVGPRPTRVLGLQVLAAGWSRQVLDVPLAAGASAPVRVRLQGSCTPALLGTEPLLVNGGRAPLMLSHLRTSPGSMVTASAPFPLVLPPQLTAPQLPSTSSCGCGWSTAVAPEPTWSRAPRPGPGDRPRPGRVGPEGRHRTGGVRTALRHRHRHAGRARVRWRPGRVRRGQPVTAAGVIFLRARVPARSLRPAGPAAPRSARRVRPA